MIELTDEAGLKASLAQWLIRKRYLSIVQIIQIYIDMIQNTDSSGTDIFYDLGLSEWTVQWALSLVSSIKCGGLLFVDCYLDPILQQ